MPKVSKVLKVPKVPFSHLKGDENGDENRDRKGNKKAYGKGSK